MDRRPRVDVRRRIEKGSRAKAARADDAGLRTCAGGKRGTRSDNQSRTKEPRPGQSPLTERESVCVMEVTSGDNCCAPSRFEFMCLFM